ncbi:hypothetical protein [Arthrobacter flavus]|uniref:DUF7793 domain-containing protein n=1 Tax=Arthrobacter flavus TaxID=95172 RepID=A0ABW4Q9R8_9MICC
MERHRTTTTELAYFISGKARFLLLDNEVLYVRWQPFGVIDAEDARNVAALVLSYLPSGNRRVLFELSATTVTPEARRIFREAKGFTAAALVGASRVDEVTWAFAHSCQHPVSFFLTHAEAHRWLENQRSTQHASAPGPLQTGGEVSSPADVTVLGTRGSGKPTGAASSS